MFGQPHRTSRAGFLSFSTHFEPVTEKFSEDHFFLTGLHTFYIYEVYRIGGPTVSIKYAILGLLHYRDMYGYEIKRHIERNAGFMWAINYGQIYPNLKQLKIEGFVTLKEVNEAGKKGPSRKLYSLTQSGRERFYQWLSDDPERFMLIRDPFFLRFMFFGFGDRSRALELIDDQIRHYENQIERRRDRMARWQKFDIYVRLLAELGVELNQRILDWLRRTREEISRADEDSIRASAARREERKDR